MLQLEDYRPEPPRVLKPISAREGALLSVIAHLVLVIVILLAPKMFPAGPIPADAMVPQVVPNVEFVPIEVLKDALATPKKEAPLSDLDRRAVTPRPTPVPENEMPRSQGNSPEKMQGVHGPDLRTSPPPEPPAPSNDTPSAALPNVIAKAAINPNSVPPSSTPGHNAIADALRHLDRYTQGQTFDNEKGGQSDQYGADIQFDSKGVDFGSWIRRFRAQVISNWFIPQAAYLLSGHVVIQFYVHRNGAITDLKIVEPSTIQSFTMSSYNALKLSNPTAPLPEEYPTESVLFTVKFFYNERIKS